MQLAVDGQLLGLRDASTQMHWANGFLSDQGWIDAVDFYPDEFSRSEVVAGSLEVFGVERNTAGAPPEPPESAWLMNHVMAGRSIGLTDNFEVQVRQDARDGLAIWSQISPLVLGDFSASRTELGLSPVFDVSAPNGVEWYIENANAPSGGIGRVFDTSFYSALSGSANATIPVPTPTLQWWVVRVVDGHIQYWFNGARMCNPINLAASSMSWALGRDLVGFNVVHMNVLEGELPPFDWWPEDSPVAAPWASRIPQIQWRPYDIPLT